MPSSPAGLLKQRDRRSPEAIITAVVASLASVASFVYGALVIGFACDEVCVGEPTSWRYDPDAWQWDAMLAGGALAALISFYALWAAITRRPSTPAVWLSAAAWLTFWITVGSVY